MHWFGALKQGPVDIGINPVTHDVAVQSRFLALPHQDPADRFLVATALIHDLTLVTADERLIRAAQCSVLANKAAEINLS
ncbi:MAG: PIN domain-containing protein [Syntrophobacteraceae bacterium]